MTLAIYASAFTGNLLSAYLGLIGWVIGLPAGYYVFLALVNFVSSRIPVPKHPFEHPHCVKCGSTTYEPVYKETEKDLLKCECGAVYSKTYWEIIYLEENGKQALTHMRFVPGAPWEVILKKSRKRKAGRD
jgi:hypothetical protein